MKNKIVQHLILINMKKIFSIILSLCLFGSAYGTAFTTDCGNTVSITATPATGYHFTQWQDGNTDNPRQVEVKSSANYAASFAPNEYTILFVNEDGTELQKSLFAYGTMPTYSGPTPTKPASAQHNYTFAGWSPAIATVTGDATYTATYTTSVNNYILTLLGENGVVTGAGTYEYGSVVTISATPLECYQFKQWSDGDTNATREITITDDIELEAIFEVITYTITVESTNQEHGTVTIEVVGTQDDTPSTPSESIGAFSVSATKQVAFSRGNLQYTQSTNTWSFAENQWDYIGTENVVGGEVSPDSIYGDFKEGNALADKIDLFSWSTTSTYFGVYASSNTGDFSGSFVDWGTNQIGNEVPNTWRTLTYDEWHYLRYARTNADSLCGVAQVNGVNGLIFLPDNWTCPDGITFKSQFSATSCRDCYAAYQTFTADQWSKLEKAGAVFLPASGVRRPLFDVQRVQYSAFYWSSTVDILATDENEIYAFVFTARYTDLPLQWRTGGRSVRLVKDL